MITSDIQGTISSPAMAAENPAAGDHGFSFHALLSAMNPLQYLPVVGTIYRAVTGDVIPEALRRMGSLVVSGIMGGPVGLVVSLAATVVEKAANIDPEKILATQLKPAPEVRDKIAAPAVEAASDPAELAPAASPQVALTPQQLAAYGVRPGPSGLLKLGDVEGADVLNTLQLAMLGKAAAVAYSAGQATCLAAPSGGG